MCISTVPIEAAFRRSNATGELAFGRQYEKLALSCCLLSKIGQLNSSESGILTTKEVCRISEGHGADYLPTRDSQKDSGFQGGWEVSLRQSDIDSWIAAQAEKKAGDEMSGDRSKPSRMSV